MRDKLLAGAPADLLILTRALIAELTLSGHVLPGSAVDIGVVRTGVAVRAGERSPPSAMRRRCAPRCSRPTPSTSPTRSWPPPASTSPRCSTRSASPPRWPRGCARSPTAPPPCRRWLARRTRAPIGCTQVTEILNTPGVTLVGPAADRVRARHRLHGRRLHPRRPARSGEGLRRSPRQPRRPPSPYPGWLRGGGLRPADARRGGAPGAEVSRPGSLVPDR